MIEGLTRLLLADSSSGATVEGQGQEWNIHYPVNLGNPGQEKIIDIARIITEMTESSSPVRLHPLPTDDPRFRCSDIPRARPLLGWEPTVFLREGPAATIGYFGEFIGNRKAR